MTGDQLSILKARMARAAGDGGSTAKVRGERVQKNLSLLAQDADRLRLLATRDARSQAELLARALDAYEVLFGKAPHGTGGG